MNDVFITQASDGTFQAVLDCNAPNDPSIVFPMCNQFFRASELDVSLCYPRIFLERWQQTQSDVQALLDCATGP